MHGSLPFQVAVLRAVAARLDVDPALAVWTEGAGGIDDLRTLDDGRHAARVVAWPVADRARAAIALGAAWAGGRVLLDVAAAQRLDALTEVLAAAGAPREGFAAGLTVRVPWGGEAGPLDGPVLDRLAALPGVRTVVPSDAGRAAALLNAALSASSPVVVLEPRALARQAAPVAFDAVADLGGSVVVREGHEVTVVALGADVGAAVAVAEATADVAAEVVDLGSAWPIDPGLAARVRRTGRLVVVAPPGEAAWGQRVVAEVLGGAFLHFEAPPAVVGLRDLSRALRDAVAW